MHFHANLVKMTLLSISIFIFFPSFYVHRIVIKSLRPWILSFSLTSLYFFGIHHLFASCYSFYVYVYMTMQ